jgi:outer membrane receptor for monomeric catechols
LRADLFRTTKENAREASPTNSLLYVLAGTQRVNGAELVLNGRITNRWQITGWQTCPTISLTCGQPTNPSRA